MSENDITAAVQRYIDALAGDAPADPIIRALLDRAVGRLEMLCAGCSTAAIRASRGRR